MFAGNLKIETMINEIENLKETTDKIHQLTTEILLTVENQTEEKPINIKQAAEHLDIAVVTLRGWVSKDKIPYHRVNGRVLYFYRSELNEFVKNQK